MAVFSGTDPCRKHEPRPPQWAREMHIFSCEDLPAVMGEVGPLSAFVKPLWGANTMSETAARWGRLQIALGKL